MRDYELVYIVNPQVAEENLTKVNDKVNQFIVARGGQVEKVDAWGKRRLAYPIGPFKEGIYFLTYFKLNAPQAQDLESSLRTTEDIIRHLVVRLEPEQVKQREEQQRQQLAQKQAQQEAQQQAQQQAQQEAQQQAQQQAQQEAQQEAQQQQQETAQQPQEEREETVEGTAETSQ